MDWLQFTSSVVSSLAWPGVVLIFLFMIRNHLSGLVARIEEVVLPGGFKARFVSELTKGREVLDKVTGVEEHKARPSQLSHDLEDVLYYIDGASNFAIMRAFVKVEEAIQSLGAAFGYRSRMAPRTVLNLLIRSGVLDSNILELFYSLQRARNYAVHTSGLEITAKEAREYVEQADEFTNLLNVAKEKAGK